MSKDPLGSLAEVADTRAPLPDVEPDPEFLKATEQEFSMSSQKRALVVLVGDHVAEDDGTGKLVTELLLEDGFNVDAVVSVRSKKSQIRQAIETAVVGGADLVLTIGGVGVGPRDKTPEATSAILDQEIPGIAQALRASGLACGAVDASVSRGVAGISGSTVVVNIAPSRSAIRDGMATLVPLVDFVVDQLRTSVV